MSSGIYISFEKEAKEAIAFYETVFQTTCSDMMCYKDMPEDSEFVIDDKTKELVMNASLMIHGMRVMFSDIPEGMGTKITMGDNINIVLDLQDEALLTKTFEQLAEGGVIVMPLEQTFWSPKYGYLVDKFGIGWQVNLS